MKPFYKKCLMAMLLLMGAQVGLQAQRLVPIASDPLALTDIFPIIMGDTSATGERVDNNTIYVLDNGGAYATSGRLVNKPEWDLQIQASDLANTAVKPVITRIPNSTGSYPDIMRAEGNVTLKNIWLIVGERAGGQEHDWGKLRIMTKGARVIVEDCILEKDRGGLIQCRADSLKIYVNRTVFRNGGNRRILQGNGRAIDARNFFLDTLVMTNSSVYNMIDRAFRSQGATQPHNYIEFDGNTFFNIAGRHGCIQLSRVNDAKITNNIFMNPIMLGTTSAFTDEQNQPDGDTHKVFTLDTLYAGTSITMASNNVFWTQDVIDVWADIDSVSRPAVLSQLIKDALGADTATAFFEEVITLESVPANITQYIEDLYNDPTSDSLFDYVVEDVTSAGTAFDNGNLFDFTTFSVCYDVNTTSATASTTAGPIGNVLGCDALLSDLTEEMVNLIDFKVMPNPVDGMASVQFFLPKLAKVEVLVSDLQGRTLEILSSGNSVGNQTISWDASRLSAGMYLLQLNTPEGRVIQKVIIR